MPSRILVFCILILASFRTFSQPIVLADESRMEIQSPIRHLRDPNGKLTFEDVRAKAIPVQRLRKLNYGFDHAAHWILFELSNPSEKKDWLLEIPFAPLDKIEFYVDGDSTLVHKTAGDLLPMSVRDIRHPHPVFSFQIPSGQSRTIYLRIESTSSIQVPLVLWRHDDFITESISVQLGHGLFYGAMIVMILYQLFLFISIRERITLYYVMTLVSMMHVVSFFQGYSFLYLYPENPELNHLMAIITGPLFLVFSTWLTRAFLNLKENSPIIDKMLLINMELDVLASVLMIIFFGQLSYRFHHYAILLHCVLALVAAGYCFVQKFRPAFYYLLSWVMLLFAAFFFSLSNLGIFPDYLNTNSSGLMIGCVLQMLLISFALGNRWNIMVRENQQVKDLELRRGLEEKERLEQEVQLRLEEINHKNEKLEEVNRIKDKLFSVVSHDIKGPLSALHMALSLTKNHTLSQDEFRHLTGMLEVKFNQTTEFIENLLQWANLQLRGETFHPTSFDLRELVDQVVMLADFELKNKNIRVENSVEKVTAFADVDMMKSVLRNLLTNAMKFTKAGGSVRLHSKQENQHIVVMVQDTGIGIPERSRKLIFSLDIVTTPGTGQERGTGLGLVLCKEFVERNGGTIWFETEEGKGTTFYFTVPTAAS